MYGEKDKVCLYRLYLIIDEVKELVKEEKIDLDEDYEMIVYFEGFGEWLMKIFIVDWADILFVCFFVFLIKYVFV